MGASGLSSEAPELVEISTGSTGSLHGEHWQFVIGFCSAWELQDYLHSPGACTRLCWVRRQLALGAQAVSNRIFFSTGASGVSLEALELIEICSGSAGSL